MAVYAYRPALYSEVSDTESRRTGAQSDASQARIACSLR